MASSTLDMANIQGDILVGLAKKVETFIFFKIKDNHVAEFRAQLVKLIPLITTSEQAVNDRDKIMEHKKSKSDLLPCVGINIGFSTWGLGKLGLTGSGDPVFDKGMQVDAVPNLGDPAVAPNSNEPAWDSKFKQHIDGILLLAGDCQPNCNSQLQRITQIFSMGDANVSIEILHIIEGKARPGKESGHEHFGFADGISQPGVKGLPFPLPLGQEPHDQGIFLLGREGDTKPINPGDPTKPVDKIERPEWALDGSFLAFRQLPQRVPEFTEFLRKHALKDGVEQGVSGAELLGARLVGRWKSGAPVDITDKHDDQALAEAPSRNNEFEFEDTSQNKCPWAAHIRKMYPRKGSGFAESFLDQHRIIRRGIPYGDEVTYDELRSGKTGSKLRGLLFVSYQSNLSNGFQFLQQRWANNVNFPPNKPVTPGFDPIIGQNSNDDPRSLSGSNPVSTTEQLPLNTTEFTGASGGEYFFSPSISSLINFFAAKQSSKLEL